MTMRMLMTAQMDTAVASRAIQDGSLPKVVQSTLDKLKPEAAFFATLNGERAMYVVFDLLDPADIPAIAEPLFAGLHAKVNIVPAMSTEDLQSGMQRL